MNGLSEPNGARCQTQAALPATIWGSTGIKGCIGACVYAMQATESNQWRRSTAARAQQHFCSHQSGLVHAPSALARVSRGLPSRGVWLIFKIAWQLTCTHGRSLQGAHTLKWQRPEAEGVCAEGGLRGFGHTPSW